MLMKHMASCSLATARRLGAVAMASALGACAGGGLKVPAAQPSQLRYEYPETQALVGLVNDAATSIEARGESAFATFRVPNSRWRQDETYIFVLDLNGNMLVHPDQAMEGKNEMNFKDINGRPIIRGLIQAVTSVSGKTDGWYHYQWPVPGGLLPRWKSTYLRQVAAPSGKRFVVGSGVYNDRMERAFVVDMVNDAVGQIESVGEAAFPLLRDRRGPFIAKDAYVFVIDSTGVELVNPAFLNLQGRNLLDLKDTEGKRLVREMLDVARTMGSGWVNYMWPKPGESVSTQKSAYVRRANVAGKWLLVGCGVYLADAPKEVSEVGKMSPPELVALVREGAAIFEQRGVQAYPEFRTKGSKWFRDDTYFFVTTIDGIRNFHAADPTLEGQDVTGATDVLGRNYGRMFAQVAQSSSGEGWVHYMYPEPGDIFPAWKSAFIKRVTAPTGEKYFMGAGVYNMRLDKSLVQDLVDRAAALVAERGSGAFSALRDKTGPFLFMDTYVFVDTPEGVEIVNPGQPSIEGTNIIDLKDVKGKMLAREYITAALQQGAAWVDYYWYKPGQNTAAHKQTYVRAVRFGHETYIVGSGIYVDQ